MCGRKTLTRDMQSIIEELAVEEWEHPEAYVPSFNIAPTQISPVLIQTDRRIVRPMRWGLIPSWARDPKIGVRMINARLETLLEKPSFRSLVTTKRCVVIADGYYEWRRMGTQRQPYYVRSPQGLLLPMAGLWDTWQAPDGTVWNTYTIITTDPLPELAYIHHRMPVILSRDLLSDWLDTHRLPPRLALDQLHKNKVLLEAYPVSTQVNSPHENSPKCIHKLDSGRSFTE